MPLRASVQPFRQPTVSTTPDARGVYDDDHLVRRLIGDAQPSADLLRTATSSSSVPVLVTAAVLAGDIEGLVAAARLAVDTRDRQLVALAKTHLSRDARLFDAMVRDHLCDYPDSIVAAWLKSRADHLAD